MIGIGMAVQGAFRREQRARTWMPSTPVRIDRGMSEMALMIMMRTMKTGTALTITATRGAVTGAADWGRGPLALRRPSKATKRKDCEEGGVCRWLASLDRLYVDWSSCIRSAVCHWARGRGSATRDNETWQQGTMLMMIHLCYMYNGSSRSSITPVDCGWVAPRSG